MKVHISVSNAAIGAIYSEQGDYRKAIAYYEKSLVMQSKNKYSYGLIYADFGTCYVLLETEKTLRNVLRKAEFWKIYENTPLNGRQRMMLNKLLDGFDGKLKSSKINKSKEITIIQNI